MKFKSIEIENFRNFDKVLVEIEEKNVIFGMNDIGKTNFLYAIRYLLDSATRKRGFTKTDYYRNNTKKDIKITIKLGLDDFRENDDTQIFIARAGKVRTSENADVFYIRVVGEYNESEMIGNPILYWGDDENKLVEMESNGYRFELDNIFKIVYIDPTVDLNILFEKNKRLLIDEKKAKDDDKKIISDIEELSKDINLKIGEMNLIKGLENEITQEYEKLRDEGISIEMKSEMAINGFFNDITPYMRKNDDTNIYPTAGDGRRKLLAYSIIRILNKKERKKIVVYLIEEPENSLHRSMQIALSKKIFDNNDYKYVFMTTHSSDILYALDNAALIRVYSKEKVVCSSYPYKIGDDFKKNKKQLNRQLTNAIFAQKVFLVEGPSELVLFEKIMDVINSDYEADDKVIMAVNGINFKKYFEVFKKLNIEVIVKTDNDLKAKRGKKDTYDFIGVNRCLDLIGEEHIEAETIEKENKETRRKEIFEEYKEKLSNKKIFLSELDLENDLDEVLGDKISEVLGVERNRAIKNMQSKKLYNMVDLIDELDEELCRNVYNNPKFKCLEEFNR